MRIQQIRFKNLNSLAGEWGIDLTHPAFAADGIFAISGPTGAGKTTILDAICLALYGRTPRLDRVSKSTNEVMSRQTGECFAEVTFETEKGLFCCHWSQHRARRKPDGELQNPKQEIVDAKTGEVLETKITAVGKKIEETTGMDFDRFTRSMLLAQGGFAAFLKAEAKDRAEILEQITGTEMYSLISIRVHQRAATEKKKLDKLQAEFAGVQLLGEEEVQQLTASQTEKEAEEKQLAVRAEKLQAAIVWLDTMAGLETDLDEISRRRQDWQERHTAFAPQRTLWNCALKAVELDGEHAPLVLTRKAQRNNERELSDCQRQTPGHERAVQVADEAAKAAAAELAARKSKREQATPVLRKVQGLDIQIKEKDAPIQTAEEAIRSHEWQLEELKAKQEADLADLDASRTDFSQLLAQIEETKADERLVSDLAKIAKQFESLQDIHRQHADKQSEAKQAEMDAAKAEKRWKKRHTEFESQQQALNASNADVAQKQEALEALLEGEDMSHWRQQVESIRSLVTAVTEAGKAAKTLAGARLAVGNLAEREGQLAAEQTDLTGRLESQHERQAALEKQEELLETQLVLLNKIQDLETARQDLRDDEPCPLCGALEHPYAKGNVPAVNTTKEQFDKVRVELKGANKDIAKCDKRQALVAKELEQIAGDREQLAATIEESAGVIDQARPFLALEPSDPDLETKLAALSEEHSAALDRAAQVVKAADAQEREIAKLRTAGEKAKDRLAEVREQEQQAAHEKESAVQLQQRLLRDAERLRSQANTETNLLQQEIAGYGVTFASLEDLAAVQTGLTARRDQWLSRQQLKAGLEPKITRLDTMTRQQADQLRKADTELKSARGRLAHLAEERSLLQQQRLELFGDQDVEAEETRLNAAVSEAETANESANDRRISAKQALEQLQSTMAGLEQRIAARAAELEQSETAFAARLGELGFAGEADFLAARLPEGDRNVLAKQAGELEKEKNELDSGEREKTQRLEAEREKRLTDQPKEELQAEMKASTGRQKQLQQEIGEIGGMLKENRQRKQAQQDRLHAIEAQQQECARWDKLHELIGSADGKKYRNFAQGLTFQMMVGHANRQLQRMTDRYLLVRDEQQPLDLNVVDNYQAGEIRSTKNLSGGESFIVSLSLALGLSQMASANVRVDSLFLDEGFGSLDEDALDTALTTLASLNQDGKLIGVISHVGALKERIATHIQVTPQTGGRSTLSGPGCGSRKAIAEA